MTATKFIPDEAFIAQLKAKQEAAFSQLYDHYSDALYGIVLRIVRREEIAQDVLQDAFVKIWKSIGSFDNSKASLFTWMLNVTRNTAIDALRSKSMRYSIQNLDDNVRMVEKRGDNHTPSDRIGVKELLDKLRPEQKKMIELAYYGGYTQEEIAEEFNIPLGTVKTHTRSALTQLRKWFT